jgi:serine/threonine kinase 32
MSVRSNSRRRRNTKSQPSTLSSSPPLPTDVMPRPEPNRRQLPNGNMAAQQPNGPHPRQLPNGQNPQAHANGQWRPHPHNQENSQNPPQSQDSSPKSIDTRVPRQLSKAQSPPSPYPLSGTRTRRPSASRKKSMSSAVPVTLDGGWPELAKKDSTLPADAKLVEATAKPSGMLGFLSRKRGRGHSPKPQERGILGKEGARVVISSG